MPTTIRNTTTTTVINLVKIPKKIFHCLFPFMQDWLDVINTVRKFHIIFLISAASKTKRYRVFYQKNGIYSLIENFTPIFSVSSLTFLRFTSGTVRAVASVSRPASLAFLMKSKTFS